MKIKIKGTVTPEIAMKLSGYDFDIRTVKDNINLHFDNGHAKTDLVCYKLGNNKYEVEVIYDPLHIFPPSLDKGDIMNTSEIVNAMIRQALKENEMKQGSGIIGNALLKKKKKSKYNGCNVTGCEDGKLTGNATECSGDGSCGNSAM